MAEIKIKVDSSDIDTAIAKVSHLLELVDLLPAGMLCTDAEMEAAPPEPVKVFINEAFINETDVKCNSGGIVDSIIKNAIDNSKEFEKLKDGENAGDADGLGFKICGVGSIFTTNNPILPPHGDPINVSGCSNISEARNMAKHGDQINQSEKNYQMSAGVGRSNTTEDEMLKLQRDAHHRFDAKLDNIAASLKENVQKTAKEAISAACRPGGTIWQVFTNYR